MSHNGLVSSDPQGLSCKLSPHASYQWNALPDSLISSAEDTEDCVAKFTSLVRVRD